MPLFFVSLSMLSLSLSPNKTNMFKLLILLVPVVSLLNVACGNREYTLNGSVPHAFFNGDTAYAVSVSGDSVAVLSKGVIERGRFSLSGSADSVAVASLYISQKPVTPFIIEPGEISVFIAEKGVDVKGTPLNDALGSCLAVKDSFGVMMADILRKEARLLMEGVPGDEARVVVEDEFAVAAAKIEVYIDSFVRAHYNDVVGPFALGIYCNGMNYSMLRPKIQKLINDAPEKFRKNRFVESLRAGEGND